jgi:hypothetical protein
VESSFTSFGSPAFQFVYVLVLPSAQVNVELPLLDLLKPIHTLFVVCDWTKFMTASFSTDDVMVAKDPPDD